MTVDPEVKDTLLHAATALEEARCLEAELEASLLFSSSLLSHPPGGTSVDATSLPGSVQDAWSVVSEASLKPEVKSTSNAALISAAMEESKKETHEFSLGRGQLGKAAQTTALSSSLKRAAAVSESIGKRRPQDAPLWRKVNALPKDPAVWMSILDERLRELRDYHARHDVRREPAGGLVKRRKVGNPVADGFDLASIVSEELGPMVQEDSMFTTEEVMGKYLDLRAVFDSFPIKGSATELVDFLGILSKGLAVSIKEADKLKERRKYLRFLKSLQTYLEGFLKRTSPFLNLSDVQNPVLEEFKSEWRQSGGVVGWEKKPSESTWVEDGTSEATGIDLAQYDSVEALEQAVGGDELKTELSRLGLKCGGTVTDRAKRLFLTKDTPLDQLPKKLFAKGSKNGAGGSSGGERRVDIARLEVLVTALCDQLRPTLEATIRRAERRQTQTLNERDKELEEELHGGELMVEKERDEEDSDDSEDEAPIYNPKGVPLGWDGKPIPYWLFKLHGLGHFYPCEICGNESYRGRRNFEKHFAENKHAFGMKCLGIPNTKHFHGVTKIEDAQQLWKTLQENMKGGQFDGNKQEEYEDSHGNVLSRSTYEDLARQGLL